MGGRETRNFYNDPLGLLELILTREDDYSFLLVNKLIEPTTSSKTYWSILKKNSRNWNLMAEKFLLLFTY